MPSETRRGPLEINDAQGYTVDVHHDVRAFGVGVALNGDFLGNGEVIVLGMLPVDERDSLHLFANVFTYLNAVPEQFVHGPVGVIELGRPADGIGLIEFVQHFVDKR